MKKKVLRIIAGLFCVGNIMLFTACQSDTSLDSGGSENELSLGTEEAVTENSSESEDLEIGTNEYSYEGLEDGTLRLTAYHPREPLSEGETLEVPKEIDGKKVTVIGEGCFSEKEAFGSNKGRETIIILPEGITTIENYIFNFEGSIKQIEIPDSVTEIKEAAFFRKLSDESQISQVPITTLIISCSKDSIAESYAINQGIKYTYTGEDWADDEAFKAAVGNDKVEYYGQYRWEGTYTDFCVVVYWNTSFGWNVYDIVVLDKETGEELQRIPTTYETIAGYGVFESGIISEEDADFDDEPELLLFSGYWGNQAAMHYYCYDWNDVNKEYIEYESFLYISNPEIDTEEQVVRGSSRGSATTHYYYTYAFIDGEFVEIEEVKSEFTSDDEEILETYNFVDGERVLVEKVIRTFEYNENGHHSGVIKEEQVELP